MGVKGLKVVCQGHVVSIGVFSFFISTRNSEDARQQASGKFCRNSAHWTLVRHVQEIVGGTRWPQSLDMWCSHFPSSPTKAPPTDLRFTESRPALASQAGWQAGCPTLSLGPSPPEARGILAPAILLQESYVLVPTRARATGASEGKWVDGALASTRRRVQRLGAHWSPSSTHLDSHPLTATTCDS